MSAPLWNSKTSTFAGLLTSSDYINVIQYYWQYPEKFEEIEGFKLDSLRGMDFLFFPIFFLSCEAGLD